MSKKVLAYTVTSITNDNRIINYSNALFDLGYQVTVVCPISRKASVEHKFGIQYIATSSSGLPSGGSFFTWLKTFEFIVKAILVSRKMRCEIIHAHDLKGLIVGALVKRIFHKEADVVYDAHEYETEVNGLRGFHKKIYKFLEKNFMKDVSKMITVSETIASEYQRLYEIECPFVLLNVPKAIRDRRCKYDLFREKLRIRADQRIFLYQGYLMPGRGIEILLNAFNGLESDQNVVVFMGKGKLESHIKGYCEDSKNIFLHDFVDPSEYLNYTSSADYGIAFIEDTSLSYRYSLPNKLFEYLFCGLPIICSNLPEMKKLVEINKVGIVVKENTAQGFRKAIEAMNNVDIEFFRQNTKATSEKYSWAKQEEKLNQLYNQL